MALSIKDIKTKLGGFFQRKLKNLITLGNDSTLESDLKPIKVGDNNTPIEVSETEVKVSGTINADAINVGGSAVQTGTDAGATELNELSDVTYSSGDLTIDSLDKIVAGSNLEINSGSDIALTCSNGRFYLYNSGNASDFTRIDVGTNGEFVLTTIDDAGSNADYTINIDGDITLDSHTGVFIAKKAGTEFSATNSAYAGMILGYTRIQNAGTDSNPGDELITINSSSMTVLQTANGTNVSIQFIVPPSGNVEIECSFWVSASSDGASFSLSTGTSYAELDPQHTYDADYTFYIDESDHYVQNIKFAVTGLTAGTDTTYYLAGLSTGAGVYIRHGDFRNSDTHHPPIILKATALPATITTGE